VLRLKELWERGFRRGDETGRLAGDGGWRSRLMLPDEYCLCQGRIRGLKGLKGKEMGLHHVGRLKLLGMLRSVGIAREGN
jgi:hypothetical protein